MGAALSFKRTLGWGCHGCGAGVGQVWGHGGGGWGSHSKDVHVRQVEEEVLQGGATRMGLGSNQGPPGSGEAWGTGCPGCPWTWFPRKAGGCKLVTKMGSSYWGHPVIQFLQGGECVAGDVATAVT